MIYYRKYIQDFLSMPFVTSFCVWLPEDFDMFFSKYFGSTNIRVTKHAIQKQLQLILDEMVQDGVLEVEQRRVRLEEDSNECIVNFYKKPQRDINPQELIAAKSMEKYVPCRYVMSSIK